MSSCLTLTKPSPKALEVAASTRLGDGDFRFLFPCAPLARAVCTSVISVSPSSDVLARFSPRPRDCCRSSLCGGSFSLFFLLSIDSRSCASSRMARSTSGKPGNSFAKSSFFSTTSKHLSRATMVAVRGIDMRIPISPKKAPGFNSAYVLSPSLDVTATAPRTNQYIALASSPSVNI